MFSMIMTLIELSQLALDVGSSLLLHVVVCFGFDLFLQRSQSCLAQKSGDRLYNDHDMSELI